MDFQSYWYLLNHNSLDFYLSDTLSWNNTALSKTKINLDPNEIKLISSFSFSD